MSNNFTITQVQSDTDWEFFLEIPWRNQGLDPDFHPDYAAWIRAIGRDRYRQPFLKTHRISAWILKRDCMPIMRWLLWNPLQSSDEIYLDLLDGIQDELTAKVFNHFEKWMKAHLKNLGMTKLESRPLLPWLEAPLRFEMPKTLLPTTSKWMTYQIQRKNPGLHSFFVKIEKARIVSEIKFVPWNWNGLPAFYKNWKDLIAPLMDQDLCWMAQKDKTTLGWILAGRDWSFHAKKAPAGLFRQTNPVFWKFHAQFARLFNESQTKTGKIFWLSETPEAQELGVSVMLLNEVYKRAFEKGYTAIHTPWISEQQYLIQGALKEIQAQPVETQPVFHRQF